MTPDFVTRREYMEHLEETKEGYSRLSRVEAEVLGDADANRPSLRTDLSRRMDKINTTMWWIGSTIVLSLISILLALLKSGSNGTH